VFLRKRCSERPARIPTPKFEHDIRSVSGRKRVRAGELGMWGTEQRCDCVNAAMSTAGTQHAGDLLAVWAISHCEVQLLCRNISDNFLLRASSNDAII